jgi:hypothetical protein
MKYDDWFQTATGRAFPLPEFTPADVSIEDIAHSLALQCRFNGHCLTFYSVAQHSVLVSHIVPDQFRKHALLHDASEAYLSDLPSPFKRLLPDYKKLEKQVMRAICVRFGLPMEMPPQVATADLTMLATEKRDLLVKEPKTWESLDGILPMRTKVEPWHWAKAKQIFLDEFFKLEDK